MSKFRSLKKKLLAGLCAFASGVSGASAAPNGFLNVIDICNTKDGNLNYTDGNLRKFRGVFSRYFGKIVGNGNNDDKYRVYMKKGYNIVTFSVSVQNTAKNVYDNQITLSVPEEFVVARLGIDGVGIAKLGSINTANEFLDLGVPAETGSVNNSVMCTVRCKLLKIFFNDILGFNFNFYDEAKGNFGDKYAPRDDCHPNLQGCMDWYFNNKFFPNRENVNLEDNKMWGLFTENVWPNGNYGGSLYYRTYHVNHVKPAPKGVWQKVGMGVLGVGTAGGIGYALFDNLIRRPKEKEVLNRYRKLAEDKAENLVRETEVKKVLKKAKGNGASRRRQGVKKAYKPRKGAAGVARI